MVGGVQGGGEERKKTNKAHGFLSQRDRLCIDVAAI
jgi:hypothetical protein